jgi:hypothetical protein
MWLHCALAPARLLRFPRERHGPQGSERMGGQEMNTLTKKLCAATLGLMLLCVAASSANAQSFRGRLSNGEKAGVIGGGAAAGAVIGGLLGGKKGAIIGGLLGAGGGSAYVYANGRNDDRYRGYRGYNGYSYYGNDRRWEGNRFDNERWGNRFDNERWDRYQFHDRDHDRDYDRVDRNRSRWTNNRFRR